MPSASSARSPRAPSWIGHASQAHPAHIQRTSGTLPARFDNVSPRARWAQIAPQGRGAECLREIEPSFILAAMRLSVAILIFAAACGGSAATSSTTPGKPAETEVALPDGVPFAKLTHEQQIAFLKQKVM